MYYIESVNVLYSVNDLLKEFASFRLSYSVVGHNVVKELTSRGIFHDQI